MNRQVQIKAEQIARMIVMGRKATSIAVEMGMSYDGLQRILRTPEYLQIEEQVRNGNLARMDARLAKRADLQEEVEDSIPEAMQVLLDHVKQKRDLRAALELLDRDPRAQFAKNTRKPADAGDRQPVLPSDVLQKAVKDADLTHQIMESADAARQHEIQSTLNKSGIAVGAEA